MNLNLTPSDIRLLREHQIDADELVPGAFRASSGNLLAEGRWEYTPSAQDLREAWPLYTRRGPRWKRVHAPPLWAFVMGAAGGLLVLGMAMWVVAGGGR